MDDVEGYHAWYGRKQGDGGDPWHRTLIDPGLFARIGTLPAGSRVLDVACGNGYIARRLARAGARVVGVDASKELIALARAAERTEPLGIEFHETDAAELPMLASASFDLAVSNMGIMDIERADAAIAEIGRVLRTGGRFVFSISHPCFDIDLRSAWVIERVTGREPMVFRKVTGYRRPHEERYPWNLPDGETAWTIGYHRPLSWYAQQLRSSGFAVVALDEPSPTDEFVSGNVRKEWIDEIPMHLVVEARRDPPTGAPP
ncbi:MAG TPA: class I SAM-dependent methyltransferase [Thermoplasmata archaeon]|nr:class I SAM-dependent methyltransferase [Thermoplasmata archaeon]